MPPWTGQPRPPARSPPPWCILRPAPGGARVTETAFLRAGTVEDRYVAATQVILPVAPIPGGTSQGGPGLGLDSGGGRVTVLDLATFNVMGTLEGNRVLTVNTPAAGPFSGPLWVGKAWRTLYDHTDFDYGRVWNAAEYHARVAAFEAVTVPAGTFNAFRIEGRGGVGTSVLGSSMSLLSGSSPGIETDETWWYAPDARIAVKSVIQRLGTHYRGVGRTTTELLERPV